MHPDLFSIGDLTLHSYGLLVAVGILAASVYLTRRASLLAMSRDQVMDLILVIVISGFVGARALYVIYEFDYFRRVPLEIIAIWRGGIIFYGGMIGASIGFVLYHWRTKRSILRSLDLFTPALALAQSFGRIGCFLNGCCFGKETASFFGILFPFHPIPLHPTQLYHALFNLVLFSVLIVVLERNAQKQTMPKGLGRVPVVFRLCVRRFLDFLCQSE